MLRLRSELLSIDVATNEPQPDANENLSFGTGAPY